jgi:hypothetical protein
MLNFSGEKVCICGLAEVLCPQITNKVEPANPRSVTFAEDPKFKFSDLLNLFAGRPSLQ